MSDLAVPSLPSRNLAETSAFYARLGFSEVFRDQGWMILSMGTIRLEFFPHPGLDPYQNYAGCCLRVDDVDDLHRRLSAGGLPSRPDALPRLTSPQDQPWGFREFALVDRDGNLLRGLTPLDRTRG